MNETVEFIPRLGTTDNLANFTGVNNEAVVDSTKHTWVLCDGKLKGGYPLAREDLNNVQVESILNKGVADIRLVNVEKNDIINKGIALSDASNLNINELYKLGVAKKDGTNFIEANTVNKGITRFATVTETTLGNDASLAISPYTLKTYLTATSRVFSPMFINGLDIYYIDESAVGVTEGTCRSFDDSANIMITTDLTLTVGNPKPNSTYHVFVASNDDGQTIAQVLENIIPTTLINRGYAHYRRVGSIQTNEESHIVEFIKQSNTIYYKNKFNIEKPTEEVSKILLPSPSNIIITPIIQVIPDENSSYYLGIPELEEDSMSEFNSKTVCNCWEINSYIMQKGSGDAYLLGYVDNRLKI